MLYTSNVYNVCKSYINKTGKIYKWKKIEVDPQIYGQLIFEKGAKAVQNGYFRQMILKQLDIHMPKKIRTVISLLARGLSGYEGTFWGWCKILCLDSGVVCYEFCEFYYV